MGSMTDDATARAIAWLSIWDSHGVHRTATAGDEAGADWLTGGAARLGAAPTVEPYALDRLDPVASYLQCGGARIPGVPVFDAPATSADGIAGTLGPDIAVVELSPRSSNPLFHLPQDRWRHAVDTAAVARIAAAAGLVVRLTH